MPDPEPPPPAGGAESVILKRRTYEALRTAAMRQVQPDQSQFETRRSERSVAFRLRDSVISSTVANGLPFGVELLDAGPGLYMVTVNAGYVIERVPGNTGSGAIAHACPNLVNTADVFPPEQPGAKAAFDIRSGQQVSIVVDVSERGVVEANGSSPAVRCVIEDAGAESIHYVPPTGDEDGVRGEYHYPLAILEGDQLVWVLAGSHIDHFQDLPRFKNGIQSAAENVGRIVEKYDPETNRFILRSLRAGNGIGIQEADGEIIITNADPGSGSGGGEYPDPAAGWWGTLLWQYFGPDGTEELLNALELTVEAGKIVKVRNKWPETGLDEIPGTEGTPGNAQFTNFYYLFP